MKLALINCASVKESWFEISNQLYSKKIGYFYPFEIIEAKSKKNSRDQADLKKQEDSEAILNQIKPEDYVVLFDEKGESLTSIDFSKKLLRGVESGKRRVVFVIGGAFGVSEDLKQRAQLKVSFSPMTMNHIVAQTVALEQIYRALTILKGIPYHNEG